MAIIKKISKQTENRFLNLYHLEGKNKAGNPTNYYVASRVKRLEDLKCCSHENHADGVIVYSLYGEKHDRVVLIRQYRYAIDGYIYEFPACFFFLGDDFIYSVFR